MGKKSMSKDRGYITADEWKTEWGGAKEKGNLPFNRLPFHCCALSFTPFEDPVCTEDGYVFEILNIVPYIQKFHKHPVTGDPLELKQLIKLKFHKNNDGEYHCPVLNKVFTESTHIVAVKTSGNVYCHQALDELNFKPKNLRDLLTDEPFTRRDVITIQNPLDTSARTLNKFDHVVKGIRAVEKDTESVNVDKLNDETKQILQALGTDAAKEAFAAGGGGKAAQAERMVAAAKLAEKKAPVVKKAPEGVVGILPDKATFKPGASTWNTDMAPDSHVKKDDAPQWPDPVNPYEEWQPEGTGSRTAARAGTVGDLGSGGASMRSTGAMSSAFTSTVMPTIVKNEAYVEEKFINPTKKGYLKLSTTHGDLNIELHCDLVPRACQNFLGLARQGYYNNCVFHRSIKNFMIQGGDPTGTGRGGQSIWGRPFLDELNQKLTHSGARRGVLSMANSGKNSNKSQFFILYKSAHHLDYKHTVFGQVVGGLETLAAFEKVPTDSGDKPLEPIRITGVEIFVDPYEEECQARKAELQTKMAKEAEEADIRNRTGEKGRMGAWWSNPFGSGDADGGGGNKSGVGKYLKAAAPAPGAARGAPAAAAAGAGGAGSRWETDADASGGAGGAAAAGAAAVGDAGGADAGAPAAKKAKVLKSGMNDFSGW